MLPIDTDSAKGLRNKRRKIRDGCSCAFCANCQPMGSDSCSFAVAAMVIGRLQHKRASVCAIDTTRSCLKRILLHTSIHVGVLLLCQVKQASPQCYSSQSSLTSSNRYRGIVSYTRVSGILQGSRAPDVDRRRENALPGLVHRSASHSTTPLQVEQDSIQRNITGQLHVLTHCNIEVIHRCGVAHPLGILTRCGIRTAYSRDHV